MGSFAFESLLLPLVAVEGVGVADVETGGGGAALLSLRVNGGATGSAAAPVTDPDLVASGIAAVHLQVQLGTGSLGPFGPPGPASQPQLTRRVLPVQGSVRLCLLTTLCPGSVELALSAEGGASGIGVGGLLTAGGGTSRISVEAAPWTVRTATVSLSTLQGGAVSFASDGWVHGPFSFTQSTALPDGELSLVTPVRVTSDLGRHFAGFGRLQLRFLPEPGRGVLLGSGVLALLLMGRSRLHPRSSPEVRP